MARMKLYRVKEPGQHALRDPDSGAYMVPDPSHAYPGNHPLVVAYPYLFAADEDNVETTSSNPGEKRKVGRPTYPIYDNDGER